MNCINLELQIKEIGVIPTLTHYSEIVSDITIWKNILNNIGYTSYSDILFDILSGIHTDILSGIFLKQYADILSGIYSDISGILFGIYSDILFDMGTAGPTEIWALAVEARQCPLRCGAHSWRPAVPNSQLRCEAAGGEGEGSNSDKNLGTLIWQVGEKDNVYFYFSKILLFYLFGGRTAIIAP